MKLFEGSLISNQYKLLKEIAEGDFSFVWLALDLETNQEVVLKALKKERITHRQEDLVRFKNEAKIISAFRSKWICNVLNMGTFEDLTYIVMEYTKGQSLANFLKSGGRLEIDLAFHLVMEILKGLYLLHSMGILHRDIKPENIIFQSNEERVSVQLLDFGLSRLKRHDFQNQDFISGNFAYMSPEQLGAIHMEVDERSDIYSVGILFYRLITGKLPYLAEELSNLIHEHVSKVPEKPSTMDPQIPPIVDEIILKMLEKDPEKRYQSIHRLMPDLEDYTLGYRNIKVPSQNTESHDAPSLVHRLKLDLENTDSAIDIFQKMLPVIPSKQKKAEVTLRLSQAFHRKGDVSSCEEYAKKGLLLLGVTWPRTRVWKRLFYLWGKNTLPKPIRFDKTQLSKSEQEATHVSMVMQFLWMILSPYLVRDLEKTLFLSLFAIRYSQKHQGDPYDAWIFYLSLCIAKKGGSGGGDHEKLFLHIVDQIEQALKEDSFVMKPSRKQKEIYYDLMGVYFLLEGQYEEASRYFRKSMELYVEEWDFMEYTHALNGSILAYWGASQYKKMAEAQTILKDHATQIKNKEMLAMAHYYESLYFFEKGDFVLAKSHAREGLILAKESQDPLGKSLLLYQLSRISTLHGDFKKGKAEVLEALRIAKENRLMGFYSVPIWIHHAQVLTKELASQIQGVSQKEANKSFFTIEKALRQSFIRAKRFPMYLGVFYRVKGSFYVLKKDFLRARECFMKSMASHDVYKNRFEKGLTYFDYASMEKILGDTSKSDEYLEKAYEIFNHLKARYYLDIVGDALGMQSLENAEDERFKKELRYYQRMSSIIDVSQQISSILNMDTLFFRLNEVAMKVTGAKNALIFIREANDDLKLVSKLESKDYGLVLSDIMPIVHEVILKGHYILWDSSKSDPKSTQDIFYPHVKSFLCVPIILKERVVGVCYLDNPLSSAVFQKEDVDVLKIILTQGAISMENAKLYKDAITDGLTGLFTQKFFKDTLRRKIQNRSNEKENLFLVLLDIDHFKNFNDVYGHQAGDFVLEHLSKKLREVIDEESMVSRYGGEEFAFLLTGMSLQNALQKVEALREHIQKSQFHYQGIDLSVTISLGLAKLEPSFFDAQTLIEACDRALYASKKRGRNCVSVYSESDKKDTDI
jgi:diguanylate cyclase (GGDEF)-like protein